VEPLLEKYLSYSPYSYSLNNPILISDPDGNDPRRDQLGTKKDVINIIKQSKDQSYWGLSKSFGELKGRYIYTREAGIIDMKHFFAAAYVASKLSISGSVLSEKGTVSAGLDYEIQQFVRGEKSNFAPEDAYSNYLGAEYGAEINSNNEKINLEEFNKYLQSLDPIDPKSAEISSDNVYIPEDGNSPELEKKSVLDFLYPKPFYGMDPQDHSKEINFK
jgi:hypothetical protein